MSDFSDLAGGQELEVLGAGVSCCGFIGKCDAVVQMHDFAVSFPKGNIHGVAAVQHRECRCVMDCVCHKVESLGSRVER